MPKCNYPSEFQEQCTLFQWAGIEAKHYPELDLMFAIPNGGSRRDAIEGANLKRSGVKAGVPDIFLPAAKQGRYGLFIELKAKMGKVSKNQEEMIELLRKQGYGAKICFGFEEAKDTILKYLRG